MKKKIIDDKTTKKNIQTISWNFTNSILKSMFEAGKRMKNKTTERFKNTGSVTENVFFENL